MWLHLNRRKHLKNVFFWYFYFLRNEGCFLYDSHPCFSLAIFLNSEIQHWLECKTCDFSPVLPQRAFQTGTGDSRNWEWVISRFTNGDRKLKRNSFRIYECQPYVKAKRFDEKEAHRILSYENITYIWKQTGKHNQNNSSFLSSPSKIIFTV